MPIVATANRASCGAAGRSASMKGGSTAVKNSTALGLAICTRKPSVNGSRPSRGGATGRRSAPALRADRSDFTPSQATYRAPAQATSRKTCGNAVTSAPSPSAAAPNHTRVAPLIPTTPGRTAALPRAMPLATENRLAGPGVTAITAMTARKAA